MGRCTRSGGCLQTGPLLCVSHMSSHVCTGAPTVDVDIALLHELAELREPLGGVDLGHIDGTYGSRSVESTRCSQGGSGCVHCGCRVSAQPRPWQKHRDAYYRYARHPATTMVQLQCAAGLASFSQGKPSAKPCLPNISQPRLLLNTTRKRMI